MPSGTVEVMKMRRCLGCGGLALLGEDGFRCYSCGRMVEDPQKRLVMWIDAEVDKNGDC